MSLPIDILERYWGFTSFRPFQEEIINSVLDGEDVLALLPTGGGKSLCFQIPALIKDGICIVISPLVALMKDQVNTLKKKDIKAIALTSGVRYNELNDLLDNCIYGNYKFLYLSPERLQQEIVQTRIKQMNVNLIAVDEAHCISQWGNDFRPAFKHISKLRELQPSANILALTASATPVVVKDIIQELDYINPHIVRQSFKRANIAYLVIETEDKHHKLLQILTKYKQASIIYARSRKQTVDLAGYLESKGISSIYYHGGLSNDEKEKNLNAWQSNQKLVMVATNAFGMGIDKSDVKTVIHINLPESIESYFQEAGRAGRNNEKAFAIILKNKGDEQRVINQFINVLPTIDFIKQVYRKLSSYFQIPYGEGEFETFSFNFNHFCKTYNFNPLLTYNALQVLDRNSIITLSRQYQNNAELIFLVTSNALFSYLELNKSLAPIIKIILRTYGGVFDHLTKINSTLIAHKANTSEQTIIETLRLLEKDEIISFKYNKTDAEITFLIPREDDKTINPIAKTITQQYALKKNQVAAMINYINSDSCKSAYLLSYFGEDVTENCGICSFCTSLKEDKIELAEDGIAKIISILKEKPLSSRQIVSKIDIDENLIQSLLKTMLEEKIIEVTSSNTYTLINNE